jgi:hypothetical protein
VKKAVFSKRVFSHGPSPGKSGGNLARIGGHALRRQIFVAFLAANGGFR